MLSRDARRVVREAFRETRYVVRDELLDRARRAALPGEQLVVFFELPDGRLDEIDVLRALVGADHRQVVAGSQGSTAQAKSSASV